MAGILHQHRRFGLRWSAAEWLCTKTTCSATYFQYCGVKPHGKTFRFTYAASHRSIDSLICTIGSSICLPQWKLEARSATICGQASPKALSSKCRQRALHRACLHRSCPKAKVFNPIQPQQRAAHFTLKKVLTWQGAWSQLRRSRVQRRRRAPPLQRFRPPAAR